MENSTSVFKFVTLRNGSHEPSTTPNLLIQPSTTLVDYLIEVNEGAGSTLSKYNDMNEAIQVFLTVPAFIKTQQEFNAVKLVQDAAPSLDHVKTLYDNIVVRLLTKSNTNRVFQLLVAQIKHIFSIVNSEDVADLSIVFPERLVLSFTGFHAPDSTPEEEDDELTPLLAKIQKYMSASDVVKQAKKERVVAFSGTGDVLVPDPEYALLFEYMNVSDKVLVGEARKMADDRLAQLNTFATKVRTFTEDPEKKATQSVNEAIDYNVSNLTDDLSRMKKLRALITKADGMGLTNISKYKTVNKSSYKPVLEALGLPSATIEEAESLIQSTLEKDTLKLSKYVTPSSYAMIADKWVDVSAMKKPAPPVIVDDESIMVYSNGCYLKFPFFVADLRVIEQLTVGYLPGEIAHINNTQPGEKHIKKTRRLKRVETLDSLITEDEVFHETDTQSTEKFSLEKEAAEVQSSESNWNVGTSVSATYGPVSASVDAGYSGSDSSTSSNASSQLYAKEIVQRVVDRVSNKVKRERTTRTVEEFEEKVKHVIDNSTQPTKSYVYRWLNKLVRGTLKNYGKRLMFQIDVAHPSHYYLSRTIETQPALDIPQDPRSIKFCGNNVFSIENITRDNYLAWGALYETKLEQPPAQKIIVSDTLNATETKFIGKLLTIKKDYECKMARVTATYCNGWPFGNHLAVMIGNAGYAYYSGQDDLWFPREVWLRNETEQLAISVWQGRQGFIMNIEVDCELTEDAFNAWRIKTYHAIIEAYEDMKSKAESKMSEWNPNMPGLNPAKKTELIRTELKKEAIRKMFRCNPFWVDDRYIVGNEYDPNCCTDNANAERVRFLESTFDWKNMTYELHPYFYADKHNWAQILNLSDDDPHFEAFLQASYATIRIPVHRDAKKEQAAVNFIMTNAISNYETIPENLQKMLEDMEIPTEFTVGLDGVELPAPASVTDLGIFPIPTNLVILECGNSDGVKPIGFPQSPASPTDITIPKQYSPAIIADSCPPPAPLEPEA